MPSIWWREASQSAASWCTEELSKALVVNKSGVASFARDQVSKRRGGLKLPLAFVRIKKPMVRKRVLDLVKSLTEKQEQAAG
jgi:hypothetical protein